MDFIHGACNSTDSKAHAAALTTLSYMGPALVQHQIWTSCCAHVHALLVAGLAAGNAAPEVTSASLCALTALLRACAELDSSLPDEQKSEKKQIKAVATSLQSALPQMLGSVGQMKQKRLGAAAGAMSHGERLDSLMMGDEGRKVPGVGGAGASQHGFKRRPQGGRNSATSFN